MPCAVEIAPDDYQRDTSIREALNGADVLTFRDAVQESSVCAFEPNPDNFRLMEANQAFRERNIPGRAAGGNEPSGNCERPDEAQVAVPSAAADPSRNQTAPTTRPVCHRTLAARRLGTAVLDAYR